MIVGRLIEVSLGFPTVIFTTLLLIALGYWVIAAFSGNIDLEIDADVGDVGADIGDAGADGGSADGGGFLSTILQSFDLHHMPITVVVTVIALIGWATSGIATTLTTSSGGSAGMLVGIFIALGAFVFSVFMAGRVGRLLRPFFVAALPVRRADLIGRICTVRTGRVDRSFGQAEVDDAESGNHTIQVRCNIENELSAGSQALIVDVDKEGRFVVSPDVDGLT